MTSLKIALLEIRDFRGIRRATIDCNADVVLVYGRNGAGKTTIFDAIEYALFGCNRRLENLAKQSDDKGWERHLPNALGDGSFDIGLRFQSGESIEVQRSANSEETGLWAGQPNRRDFIYRRLMKDHTRGRRSVAAVHDLALSTHLLLQSEIASFAASGTLDGEKLAALTGSGYLERCRGKSEDALKNARSRFGTGTSRCDELAWLCEQALDRKRRIALSLARRDELIRLARAYDVDFPGVASVDVSTSSVELSRILGELRRAVATAEEQLATLRALSDATPETADETPLRASVEELRELVGAVESRRAVLAQQLASAKQVLEQTVDNQAAHQERAANAEKLLQKANRLRDLRKQLPMLAATRGEKIVADGDAKREEQKADAAAEAASAALAAGVDEHARLHAQRSYIAAASDAYARTAAEEEQLERDITPARDDTTRLALETGAAREAVRAASAAFDIELQRFTGAATDIDRFTVDLEALIQGEADCPLCGSSFGSPSALANAIAAHAEKRTATLEAGRRMLEERRRERDRVEAIVSRAEAALSIAKARWTTLEANRSRVVAARENAAEQLSRLSVDGKDSAQTLDILSARLGDASARVEQLRQSATDASARLATARQKRQDAEDGLKSAASALASAQLTRASLESDLRQAAEELAVAPQVEAIFDLVRRLAQEGRAHIATAQAHTLIVREVSEALTRVSDDLASAEGRYTAEQLRLRDVIYRREVRTQQLAVLGMPSTASRSDFESAVFDVHGRHSRLRELANMMSQLVDIANSGTVTDLVAAEQELARHQRDLGQTQVEVNALSSISTTLRDWETSLKQRVEAAVREFVLPRATEIEHTFRSLVADPFRFERISVGHDVSRGLRLGLVFRSLTEPSGSPEFFLSAAQMSALALSIFLSLARSQKWSWLDTILLDDPVQHLDDLDCMALLDGLRNVARQSRSKQLIISTCDRSLYHHMIRKFSMALAPSDSTLLAIRLEEDLANGIRLHYEVDSRRRDPNTAVGDLR